LLALPTEDRLGSQERLHTMPAANVNSTAEAIARDEWLAVDFDANALREILAEYSTRIEPDGSKPRATKHAA